MRRCVAAGVTTSTDARRQSGVVVSSSGAVASSVMPADVRRTSSCANNVTDENYVLYV